MFQDLIIRLLFRLVGNSVKRTYRIPYLFGASTATHAVRQKKWEKALSSVRKNKDFLDFLYYQAESDKENIVRGKIRADLSRGARIRTLFLVYSMHRASLEGRKSKQSTAQGKADVDNEAKALSKVYKEATDTGDY